MGIIKEEMTMKKMMTNIRTLAALLIASATFAACSSDDNIIDQQPAQPAGPQVYTMTVEATKGDDGTRALADGGNKLTSTWTAGDEVEVWTSNGTTTKYGTLTAQSDGASTTLTGTLTTKPSDGETLTLKYLSPSYSSQDGTLTGNETSIDKVCDYATATVTATVDGDNVTTTDATFENQQAVVKFTLKNKANDSELSATKLFVTANGTIYTVTPSSAASEIYVAIPGFSAQTVTLTATVGEGTYTYEKANVTFTNGRYYAITVKMTKIPEGAISGKFSVSATKKVYFSKGNLKYNGSTWSFFDNQYDYIGSATGYPMDLFTWGNIANPTYDGTTYYTENSNLSGTYDWGSNIGEGWYTLSTDEWTYVFNKRSTTSGIRYAKAQVNSVSGVILLPDDWSTSYYTLASANTTRAAFTDNNITADDWTSTLEAAGCVFLPAAGNRYGSSVNGVGSGGDYWSSTAYNINYAYLVYFGLGSLDAGSYGYRHYGCSVRLVRQE